MILCLSLAHSAQASVLATMAVLYRELFLVCPNGCIPNLKLVSALRNLHANKLIFHHKETADIWMPTAGGLLRMVASHWVLLGITGAP